MISGVYKNKKTDEKYVVFTEGLDCTNEREGTRVVLYIKYGDININYYVRELTEFTEKFDPIVT